MKAPLIGSFFILAIFEKLKKLTMKGFIKITDVSTNEHYINVDYIIKFSPTNEGHQVILLYGFRHPRQRPFSKLTQHLKKL